LQANNNIILFQYSKHVVHVSLFKLWVIQQLERLVALGLGCSKKLLISHTKQSPTGNIYAFNGIKKSENY